DALNTENSYLFPESGLHPYDDQQITDNALAIERSEVLESIRENDKSLTVTSVKAITEKIIRPDTFSSASLQVSVNYIIEPDKLKKNLVDQQYSPVKFVDHKGEFARRGGILDVFPLNADYPVRIEFFGDEVDSIREFDPDSQRSISFKKNVRFVPDVTKIQKSERRQLLHLLNDDTIIVLFNASLVFSEFEQQFSEAEEMYEKLDDKDKAQSPKKRFVQADSFRKTIDGKSLIGFGAFASEM